MNYLASFGTILKHPKNSDKKLNSIFRIGIWKFFQFLFKQEVISILPNGTKMLIPAQSSYGSIIQYCRGYPDFVETNLMLHLVKHGDVFIDVGANIGFYSVLALGQDAKVYAFEPNETLHSNLLDSAKLNNYQQRLHLSENIVSDHTGYENFVIEPESEKSHIGLEGLKSKKIKCIALDKFVEEQKINHIKLLKIDVEGAEPQVFKGMHELLDKRQISYLLFEHDPKNNGNKFYFKFIEKLSREKILYSISQFQIRQFEFDDLQERKNLFVNFSGTKFSMP